MGINPIKLDCEDNGPSVVCAGHIDPVAFVRRIDLGDVDDLLSGEGFDANDELSPKGEKMLLSRVRHTWGTWTGSDDGRYWRETRKGSAGAKPFTYVG